MVFYQKGKPDRFTHRYEYDAGTRITHVYTSEDNIQNRLYHVNDLVSSGSNDDIDDQGSFTATPSTINQSNNYSYDEIGNLIKDNAENIASIKWTVSGKIKKIIRAGSSGKPDLEFIYDASGNRITKIVKPDGSSTENGGADNTTLWTYTYYVRDAQGNPMAMYSKTTDGKSSSFKLVERDIYGSSRLGTDNPNLEMMGVTAAPSSLFSHILEAKQYELVNHLGNVQAVITDRKIPRSYYGTTTDYYMPDIVSAQDYYPGGMLLPNRQYESSTYRFGFNGQERDNEISGTGNLNTAPFWEYDTRLVRRWNLDPITLPDISSYSVFGNSPIINYDLNGDSWDVKKTEKDGKTSYDITVTGAVFNNSGQSLDMQKLRDNIIADVKNHYSKDNINGVAGNIDIRINVNIRAVASLTEVNDDDHLIVIESDKNFDKHAGAAEKNAYADIGGLKIVIPFRTAEATINGSNHRTISHELGHTAGLYHPLDFNSPIVQGVNKYDLNDRNNLMNGSYVGGGDKLNFTQIKVMYDNVVSNRINQQTQFEHRQVLIWTPPVNGMSIPCGSIKIREGINYGRQHYVSWKDRFIGP